MLILEPSRTALLIIDVQEKLFPRVENNEEVLNTMIKVIKGFQILGIPIYVTEQYPQGLGETIPEIKHLLGPGQIYFSKTSFSCLGNEHIQEVLLSHGANQWVLVGLEAHVCVLQSARSLLQANQEVVVLNDAISSRSVYDFSTAIAEMRDMGVRISSSETILFDLLRDANAPQFKSISQLIKS